MPHAVGLTSERLGRIVEEAASEVYIFCAKTFLFRFVNKGARENLGYDLEELRSLTPWDIKPDISRDDFMVRVAPLLKAIRSGSISILFIGGRTEPSIMYP